MTPDSTQERGEAKKALLDTLQSFDNDDALRDLWVFDGDTQQALFLRDDVEDALAGADVERYINNERYGFVTRDTYNALHYAEFYYTVRGFDEFEQYRTFVAGDETRVGVLCSFDRQNGGYDFADLTEHINHLGDDYAVASLRPE